jgi:hypothetical protein
VPLLDALDRIRYADVARMLDAIGRGLGARMTEQALASRVAMQFSDEDFAKITAKWLGKAEAKAEEPAPQQAQHTPEEMARLDALFGQLVR